MAGEPESGATKRNRGGKSPPGFGDIARRMTSRTTDLIAISVVAVASLTFGRQLLEWWHAAPVTSPAANGAAPVTQPAWEDRLQPVALEFGDLPFSMTRQAILGDAAAAVDALVRHCEKVATAAHSPWRARDAAEDQLLARVAGLEPVAQEPDVWKVYVVDRRFPMVAGIRYFAQASADRGWPGLQRSEAPEGEKAPSRSSVATPFAKSSGRATSSELQVANGETARGVPRLVCWGLAMPAGKDAWNLFVFQAAVTGSAASAGLPDVPLPPACTRNLSLRDERGGLLVGFSGIGEPSVWMKFYDDWFIGNGWSSGEGWLTGGGWSVRFHKPGRKEAGRVEIQFAAGPNRELMGLLQVVPAASED